MSSIELFQHQKVVVLYEDQSTLQAARAMYDNGIGCVVVSDHHGRLVGIVTDRDLACNVLAFSLDVNTPLSEVMTPNPITVEENSELEDAIQLMIENGIRRLPIIHHSGHRQKCIGMITLDDLIAARSCQPERLATLVKSQVIRLRKHIDGKHFQKHDDVSEESNFYQRSEAHSEHTLNRFYKRIRTETGLGEDQVEPFTKFMLSTLVQRLHFNSAAHFVAQLPKKLHEDLLDLPAGPNRKITMKNVLNEVRVRFHLNENSAKSVLHQFFHALRELIDPREMDHIRIQLPEDMRTFIYDPAAPLLRA